jgi:PBSX family phage portal protein
MGSKGAVFEADDPNEDIIVDDVFTSGSDDLFVSAKRLKEGNDPFEKLDIGSLDRNAKRRADRLVKKLEGTGGARAKFVTIDSINGYMLYGLALPPFNLEYLIDLTYQNPIHYACIMAKTMNVTGLGYAWAETNKIKEARQAVEEDDEAMLKLSRKLSRGQSTLDDLVDGWNAEQNIIDTLMAVWMDYEATGNGYMEIGRTLGGKVGYVGHIPADTMRVRIDRDGFIQMVPGASRQQLIFFRNFGDRTTANPLGGDDMPNEVIHFKKQGTKNTYYGIPDIIAAMHAVAGDKFSAEYNLEYFENKAVPRYALIVKGAKLSEQAQRKILEYFRKEVKGKHHGTLYIPVPAGAGSNVDISLEAIENKIQDSSFDKYRVGNRMEIAAVHRTPLSQIGLEGDTNMSSAREASKMFKDQVIRPAQRMAERKVNQLIKEFTDVFTFKLSEFDLLDEETKNRIHDRYIRMGVYNSNEVRAELGKAPRRGGDAYVDIAALNAAQVDLTEAQGEATLDPPAKPVAPTTGSQAKGKTGAASGPKRKTTDGSPKNNGAGTTKTPVNQTSAGQRSKNQALDAGDTK